MKQQCTLLNVWLTWLGIPALALVVGFTRGWLAGAVVLVVAVAVELVYLKVFPSISRALGYGSVADEAAARAEASAAPPQVLFYTANVCPFCPIVRRRLEVLQRKLDFELREIDVTFRPEIVRSKGLKAVPVVEAGGRVLRGNATSKQLADLLTGRDLQGEVGRGWLTACGRIRLVARVGGSNPTRGRSPAGRLTALTGEKGVGESYPLGRQTMKRVVLGALGAGLLLALPAATALAGEVGGHNLVVVSPPMVSEMANGVTYSAVASRQVCGTDDPDHPLNRASGDCSGACVTGGDTEPACMGSCTWVDRDGDVAFFTWTGADEGSWRLAGGTGKYAAASGEGTWKVDAVYAGGITGNSWSGTIEMD